MKKVFLWMAFATFSLALNAQHATPLDFTLTSVNLDSLRAEYPNILDYKTELEFIQKSQKTDATNLSDAQKQLKEEQTLQKNTVKYLQTVSKSISTLEKKYQDTKKQYEALRKECNKQREAARKLNALGPNNSKLLEKMLNTDYRTFEIGESDIQNRLGSLAEQKRILNQAIGDWSNLSLELTQKENNLKRVEADFKIRQEAVKAELKAIAEQVKAAKKK